MPTRKERPPMETPARCQGCTEKIASLEGRIAEMEKYFAVLRDSRLSAAERAAERWRPAAS